MPVLQVPYFIQPDSTSCQSTVLKMLSVYIDSKTGRSVEGRAISAIKADINGNPNRPEQSLTNAWANFHWWLKKEYPDLTFRMDVVSGIADAIDIVRRSISAEWPVLVSTDRNIFSSGHIILVVGVMRWDGSHLVEPYSGSIGQNLVFVCHDPFGDYGSRFFETTSRLGWGSGRYDIPGGYCAPDGEMGPGMFVSYSLEGIQRSSGQFLLLRPS